MSEMRRVRGWLKDGKGWLNGEKMYRGIGERIVRRRDDGEGVRF